MAAAGRSGDDWMKEAERSVFTVERGLPAGHHQVVADHDTGGFAVNGPQAALLQAGGTVEAGWTTGNHTGVDTLIWSAGPGSKALARAIGNTEIYGVMVKALGDAKE